jgi:hypothetical protein
VLGFNVGVPAKQSIFVGPRCVPDKRLIVSW